MYADSVEDLVRDVESYVDSVVANLPAEMPLFMFGHSMGGLLTGLFALREQRVRFAGFVSFCVGKWICCVDLKAFPRCFPVPALKLARSLVLCSLRPRVLSASFRQQPECRPSTRRLSARFKQNKSAIRRSRCVLFFVSSVEKLIRIR
jgi:pimeloyl-ACP methyl ester carboxylesterase